MSASERPFLAQVAIDDDVAIHVAQHRLEGETDDDVVARLVRAAIGIKPS